MIQKNNPSHKFFKKKFYHNYCEILLKLGKMFYFCHRIWRDGRVVDRDGLENR
jgi:hypothetical protein